MFNLAYAYAYAYANAKDIQFEISDCLVQNTSTSEKSGPCAQIWTEAYVERSFNNNKLKAEATINNTSETRSIYSNLARSLESTDPFRPSTK